MVSGNAQVSVGQTYSVEVSKGFLVVAYPEEGVRDTEFGFNYWLEAVSKEDEKKQEEKEKEDENDNAVPIKENENVKEQLVIGEKEKESKIDNELVEEKYTEEQTTSELDDMMFYGLCAGAVVLLIAIVVLCYKCRKQGKVTTGGLHVDMGYPSGNNSNERSLQIDSMVDVENDTNRQDSKDNESNKEQGKMNKDPTFV